MYPAAFEYLQADSFEEAAALLADHGEDAKLLAGGQSLVPMMHLRLARPGVLIDLNAIGRGTGPEMRDGWLHIPALTRQRALERLPIVLTNAPLFSAAAAPVGNIRVRSRGTVGGNLAHADPSSETACASVATGAVVDVLGPEGPRDLAISELLISDLTTSLEAADVIRGIRIPVRPGAGYGFSELARRAGEFAIVNAAAVVSLGDDGLCAEVRLACGGVGARIFDASAIAAAELTGKQMTPERITNTARAVADEIRPRDDQQASASYRKRMAVVFVARALTTAFTDAEVRR